MASSHRNIPSTAGYDVHVIGEYPPQLHCGICTLIMQNAMHGCSNHMFCKACITKHIEIGIKIGGNVVCPGGCAKVINPTKLEPSLFVDRMINTLSTKCSNADCNWQGDLLDLVQVHETNCDYVVKSCGNEGCNEKVLSKDIIQHDNDCLFKTIQCSYCENYILRKNQEQHGVECLNEKIICVYHGIGCTKEFCRRDIHSHNETHQAIHMKLMYQHLIDSKKQIVLLNQQNVITNEETTCLNQQNDISNNEITLLKQQNDISNNEITLLKQDNVTSNNRIKILEQQNDLLKKNLENLESKSNEEVFQCKQEIKSITIELKEMKIENSSLISKIKNRSRNKTPSHQVNDIDHLKEKLNADCYLREHVSLIDNDKTMMMKKIDKVLRLQVDELSDCYKSKKFDLLINKFGLNNNISLMVGLLDKIPHHIYEYFYSNQVRCYTLVFPLDLKIIDDMIILVPDKFKMIILNNEISVENLTKQNYVIDFYIGKYKKTMQTFEKFNIEKLSGYETCDTSFAAGFALLDLWWKKF